MGDRCVWLGRSVPCVGTATLTFDMLYNLAAWWSEWKLCDTFPGTISDRVPPRKRQNGSALGPAPNANPAAPPGLASAGLGKGRTNYAGALHKGLHLHVEVARRELGQLGLCNGVSLFAHLVIQIFGWSVKQSAVESGRPGRIPIPHPVRWHTRKRVHRT